MKSARKILICILKKNNYKIYNMKIANRQFHREYEKIEAYEAGIALTGSEVKTIRDGGLKLENAFVKLLDDGPYLVNAEIPHYKFSHPQGYDPRRSRKLLLHKSELIRLKTKLNSVKGLTIIPVSCYNKRARFKLGIALCKGRKEVEKRKLEKNRDIEREEKKKVKEWMKN